MINCIIQFYISVEVIVIDTSVTFVGLISTFLAATTHQIGITISVVVELEVGYFFNKNINNCHHNTVTIKTILLNFVISEGLLHGYCLSSKVRNIYVVFNTTFLKMSVRDVFT